MRQIAILLLLPLMLTGCSSDDDSSNSNLTNAFFTINRNGQLFTQDMPISSIGGMQNCSSSGFELKGTIVSNAIENSEFGFSPGIISPKLKSDIDNNLEVATNILIPEEDIANVDCVLLYQFFPQYWEVNNSSLEVDNTADNINNIVEISMFDDRETNAWYAIRGNYNVTYTDDLNYSINIYGEYVLHVTALK